MTLSMARRLLVGTAGALALVAATTLPAQAKTSSPEKWGSAFCGGLSDWAESVTSGATEIQTSLQDTVITPTEGKATIIGYLGDIVDATGDFHDAVKKAGTPDTTNGSKIHKTILAGIDGVGTRVGDMQALAEALPTTDPASFQTSVQAFTAAFDTVTVPFDEAMDKVTDLDKKDALSDRLQKVKACKVLFG